MHILKNRWYFIAALAVVLGVAVWRALPMLPFHGVQANGHRTATATTPIQHIVIIMLENHGFDNMFGRFPTMAYVSGSYSTGALFQVQTTLPNGNHKFFVTLNPWLLGQLLCLAILKTLTCHKIQMLIRAR